MMTSFSRMCRIVPSIVVALALWTFGPLVAHAVTWQHQYDADLLPEDPGSILNDDFSTSSWDFNNTGNASGTFIDNGVLKYNSDRTSGGAGRRDWRIGTNDSATGDSRWDARIAQTVDIRFKLGAEDSSGAGARINWADGDYNYHLDLARTRAISSAGDSFPLDLAGDFALVRVAIDGSNDTGTAHFLDHTGAQAAVPIAVSPRTSDRNSMFFAGPRGKEIIDLEIDYIHWTKEGAFDLSQQIDLIPEPTSVTLLLVGMLGISLARRRIN